MGKAVRLSMSLEPDLQLRLDDLVRRGGFANRSACLRQLIHGGLVDERWDPNEEIVGTITLVYDHHRRRLSERITDLQHEHHERILASTHVHLDAHMCAEMILVRGPAREVKHIADELRGERGVLHATLSRTTPGRA